MPEKALADLEALVVDDDPMIPRLVAGVLKSIGVERVQTAADGADAWVLIGDLPFDLIVCDWEMPEMDGIELLRRIREAKLETPFVMLTARATPESVSAAVELGVDGYVAKPFDPNDLQDKLRTLIQRITA